MPVLDYSKKLDTLDRRMGKSEDLVDEDEQLLCGFCGDLHPRLLEGTNIQTPQQNNYNRRIDGHHLENTTKEDIKELLAWMNQKDLTPATRADHRIILKRFFK